jgi:hypothetical protein
MTDERRSWVATSETPDPELELSFTLGDPRVTDAEIDQLCELARSGTAEAVPDRPFTVNRVAGIRGFAPVVVEEPPGRYRLDHDIAAFAGRVLENQRSRRREDRTRQALLAALASLPADYLRVLEELCAPPRPLESAVRGVEVDDPGTFASAVNTAARTHGISEPVMEASASTVRAAVPPDHLVGAVLHQLSRKAEQLELNQLAGFLATLGPDETALLRHLAGSEIADEAALRRLDPTGDHINEQARRSGLADRIGLPALLSRDDWNQWSLPANVRARLRDLWKPPRA